MSNNEKSVDLFDSLMNDTSSANKNKISEIVEELRFEIDLIPYGPMREIVSLFLSRAQEFWVSPSTNILDHYPPDEYSIGGLVCHVKRTIRAAFCLIATTYLEEDDITAIYTAALLHCVTKPLLFNESSDPTEQLYDPNYIISIDRFIDKCLSQEMFVISYPILTPDQETRCQNILQKAVRLIHCCEGLMSPISELVPETNLEIIMAGANLVAKNLHVIVDGTEVIEERWTLGN